MVDNHPQQHDRVQAVTGIPPVRLLLGHVDADTAYVVDDYPYSYRLRCRIRYWIDADTRRSSHAGWQRFVSQTTNPRRGGIHVRREPSVGRCPTPGSPSPTSPRPR